MHVQAYHSIQISTFLRVISRHNGPFALCPLTPDCGHSSVQVGCAKSANSGSRAVSDQQIHRRFAAARSAQSKIVQNMDANGAPSKNQANLSCERPSWAPVAKAAPELTRDSR